MSQSLIVAMPNGFDLNLSRASQTIRLGYYHGSTVRALIEYCGSEMVELGYLSREERAKWRRA